MTRHRISGRPAVWSLYRWSAARPDHTTALIDTLHGPTLGRFRGLLSLAVAHRDGRSPRLSVLALGGEEPTGGATVTDHFAGESRTASRTVGPRQQSVARPSRDDGSPLGRGGPDRTRTVERSPGDGVAGARPDRSDAETVPSRRATSSSLPPLSATESTAEEDDDASASPLATLGRLATSVLHVARAMPATGVSASTVSLAVRSFALRHGGDSDLSVSTTAALGPSGLSESDGRTVRPVATAGSGQDSPASEAPPLRYGVASTGDRSSPEEGRRLRTDDQPSPGDDGSTPPKGSRDSDRTPDEESRPSVPPDRQTAGVLSERLDRERPETPERTATSRREQRSDPDGPEKDTSEAPSLPTLSDIGLDVDEDGVVEERGLSTAADRDVQRLYRAFRRRLRTERRRRGL